MSTRGLAGAADDLVWWTVEMRVHGGLPSRAHDAVRSAHLRMRGDLVGLGTTFPGLRRTNLIVAVERAGSGDAGREQALAFAHGTLGRAGFTGDCVALQPSGLARREVRVDARNLRGPWRDGDAREALVAHVERSEVYGGVLAAGSAQFLGPSVPRMQVFVQLLAPVATDDRRLLESATAFVEASLIRRRWSTGEPLDASLTVRKSAPQQHSRRDRGPMHVVRIAGRAAPARR